MNMRITIAAVVGAVLAGCISFNESEDLVAAAISPDGRNSIRLYLNPLSYEVARDGEVVVARSKIGMKFDGRCVCEGIKAPTVTLKNLSGTAIARVYKKDKVDLSGAEALADFGDWSLRLAARNDGVAYRFELNRKGGAAVNGEKFALTVPEAEAKMLVYRTRKPGCEETVPRLETASEVVTDEKSYIYLPLVYTVGDVTVAVSDADVKDYPRAYFKRAQACDEVTFDSFFAAYPEKAVHLGPLPGQAGWAKHVELPKGGRFVNVVKECDYLVKATEPRTFPWRTFALADSPSKLVESDLIFALARPESGYDFSWVKPGKVAWDWWNAFDNIGDPKGCTTATYKRFIDFAAANGVEYVIMDEGWSETLNIWKFHPNVDVPSLVTYAKAKGVGIILWMAWAQIYGEEAKVAEHFSKMGVKGFKVDFMDRSDAAMDRFLWTFAEECAKRRLVLDYHGVVRPSGMSRAYPNVLNYEGIHGLEQMKFFRGQDMMFNDVACVFGRLSAGPMDYTPGAMDNYPVGGYPRSNKGFDAASDMNTNPGSEGTRCHQMAMMVVYEAPLQMLSDSPTKYEKNMESFSFMAKVPVVWGDTVALGGCPESYIALARRGRDGAWYAAALNNKEAREIEIETDFLEDGQWKAEVFRDAPMSDTRPRTYVHETIAIKAGEPMTFKMAKGGGFIVRFTR